MPQTRLAVEFQLTQEYSGQQRHVCYLGPAWSQVLRFGLADEGDRPVADIVSGLAGSRTLAPTAPGPDTRVCTYFLRKSGIPDAKQRLIYA